MAENTSIPCGKTRQSRLLLASASICALFLSACDTSTDDASNPDNATLQGTVAASVSTSPANVMSNFVLRNASAVASTNGDNLLNNGDFENGTAAWTECTVGSLSLSNNAYNGSTALQVSAGNCFYQSLETTPGAELVLSCYARGLSSVEWAGMGLGFSGSGWQTISETPATVVGSTNYARYDVRAVAPPGTAYVSMWFYSETDALVDTCTLVPADEALEPPINTSNNLLDNPQFNLINNGMPDNWQQHCRGSASISKPETDEATLLIQDGACVIQALSATDTVAMQGNMYELACNVDFNNNGYASMSLNIDGAETVAVIPGKSSSTVRLTVLGPDVISSGFVSIYSEADAGALRVNQCSLRPVSSGTGEFSGYEDINLLFNGSFDDVDANAKPQGWSYGCGTRNQDGGSWSSIESANSGAALELSSSNSIRPCIRQFLPESALALLEGNTFSLSCDAWNYSGGSARIWLDKDHTNRVIEFESAIEPTDFYEPVVIAGEFTQASTAVIGFSGDGLRIDNCVLVANGESLPKASIDVRANIEGLDSYSLNTAPYTFDAVITNDGDLPLYNVSFDSDDVFCESSIPSLQAGESLSYQCQYAADTLDGTYFAIQIDATANDSMGNQVMDTDGIRLRDGYGNQFYGIRVDIKADKPVVEAGDDATFIVSVATTGNLSSIASVESSHSECVKTFPSPLTVGQYDVYACTLTNLQTTTTVTVEIKGCPSCNGLTYRDTAYVRQ